MLDLEQIPHFEKGLDLCKASEEAFEVKDVYNSTLDSEAIKQTLYRQAKHQVGVSVGLLLSFPPAGLWAPPPPPPDFCPD